METSDVDNDGSRKRSRARSKSTEQEQHEVDEQVLVCKRREIDTSNAKVSMTSKYLRGANAVAGIRRIDGVVMISEKVVGRCDATMIQRGKVASDFQQRFERYSDGTYGMALEVLDEHGYLKDRHCHDPEKKGSGVWQDELNSADLLLFKEITIDHLWRRQGLGTQLVESIIEHCRSESRVFFEFVFTTGLATELHRRILEEDG